MNDRTILIVGNNKEVAQTLSGTVSTLGYNVADCATSLDRALCNIISYRPDLIFVDLELRNNSDSVKLGEIIYKELHTPYIFTVSNNCKNTIDAIKQTRPNGILLYKQNVQFAALYVQSTIELAFFDAREAHDTQSTSLPTNQCAINGLHNGLFIKTGELYKKIMFEDILWLQGDDNYTLIYTKNRKFAIKKVLKSLEEILPENQFMRIHKSYIVQLGKITSVNYKNVFLDDKAIPMSRQIRPMLMAMMNVV
jgi:two-component system, LytTR family, response regulator LytT